MEEEIECSDSDETSVVSSNTFSNRLLDVLISAWHSRYRRVNSFNAKHYDHKKKKILDYEQLKYFVRNEWVLKIKPNKAADERMLTSLTCSRTFHSIHKIVIDVPDATSGELVTKFLERANPETINYLKIVGNGDLEILGNLTEAIKNVAPKIRRELTITGYEIEKSKQKELYDYLRYYSKGRCRISLE